ncbi:hypothetical protein VARIO8X_90036 [Burkholderiales bacterium 8X]|nr:hypothetical protein VARIO8X_90036 [Burkholderiales bacterium 8X]
MRRHCRTEPADSRFVTNPPALCVPLRLDASRLNFNLEILSELHEKAVARPSPDPFFIVLCTPHAARGIGCLPCDSCTCPVPGRGVGRRVDPTADRAGAVQG